MGQACPARTLSDISLPHKRSQVSATLLGEPDMGLLTPPEMARKVGQICTAASSLTVIADADSGEPGGSRGGADMGRRIWDLGYRSSALTRGALPCLIKICCAGTEDTFAQWRSGGGNVLNVQRTIKQLIASGAKGCFIEDKEWPKHPSAGNLRNDPIIAMEEVREIRGREREGCKTLSKEIRGEAYGNLAHIADEVRNKRLEVTAGFRTERMQMQLIGKPIGNVLEVTGFRMQVHLIGKPIIANAAVKGTALLLDHRCIDPPFPPVSCSLPERLRQREKPSGIRPSSWWPGTRRGRVGGGGGGGGGESRSRPPGARYLGRGRGGG